MALLIVGDPEDLTAAYVAFKAEEHGLSVLRLAEDRFGLDWAFGFDDLDPTADRLLIDGAPLPLDEVSGAYARFHHAPAGEVLDQIDPEVAEVYLGQRRSAMHLLLDRLSCPVVNPPTAGHSNGSKPHQMRLLERSGLRPPRWIASNDVEEIRAFAASCPGGAIVKSCSGLRSEVRALDETFLGRLVGGSPPVVAQDRIPGDDVRVHTVGEESFATYIRGSDGVDYRFSESGGQYVAGDVPGEISDACHRFAAAEGLLMAGFDFRVTDEGRWWCLECNPAPTFLPYEMATGQPICEALLQVW